MIRALFIGVLAWLISFAALAQSPISAFPPGMFQNRAAQGGNAFSFTFAAGIVEATNTTPIPYTFTPSAGANNTDPNRYLVVVACARMTTNTTTQPSSVTIDGQAATLVNAGTTSFGNSGTNTSQCSIWQQTTANTSCSTSCSVSVTYAAAAARTGACLYRLVTGTSAATNSNNYGAGTGIATANLTVPVGGKGLAAAFETGATTAMAWTNATSDFNGSAGGSSRFECASVTVTGTNSISNGVNTGQSMSLAAWGP